MKEQIREKMKKARSEHHFEWGSEQSSQIAKSLQELEEFKKAKTVMLYASVGSEVGTEKLIADCHLAGKKVCLPVTLENPKRLLACEVHAGEEMKPGVFGIPQPLVRSPVSPSSIEFIVVPGIAFDREGNRIGYGGGYYDAFLHHSTAAKVAIAYSVQLMDRVPAKPSDIPVDCIVTEKEIIDCKANRAAGAQGEKITPIRVVVLASGRGSDFQSILDGIEKKEVHAEIVGLITDNPQAQAIERAKTKGIQYFVHEEKEHGTREAMDDAIKMRLDELRAQLVVLAGYMKIIKSRKLLDAYGGKMINIHPSLLPKYPGAHAQQDAFEAGEKISGYTVHFVDSTLDGGPLIYQEEVDISGCKDAQEAAAKILEREHIGLPKVVDGFARGIYRQKQANGAQA